MTDSVVVEGHVRFRDGKKWKTRWVVLRKPSPVADCLVLLVYKDKSDKTQGHKERASLTLEDICGLEVSAQGLEGAPYTLAVVCLSQAAVLGFDSKDTLLAWEIRIRYSLGEVHRFSVGVLPGTKLEAGPATLHLCNNLLALSRDNPPAIIGHWNLPDLRRYGPVPNGFVFEGGTRCGYWAGVFFLASAESEHISFLFDCIVRGVSPTRSPFGLRPVLPDLAGDSQAMVQAEEKVNQEAQELERRLSLLSHRYSTASSSAYVPSAAGDDRSISGSSDTSDTSQSDGSVGSRLTVWAPEPGPAPAPTAAALFPGSGLSPCLALGTGAFDIVAAGAAVPIGFARLPTLCMERLSISLGGGGGGGGAGGGGGGGGGARPATAKPPRPLQEIGRQHSSDSGIATTGSHSSYSGSFSSYTSSLDGGGGGGGGEEYVPTLAPPPPPPAGPTDLRIPCTCRQAPACPTRHLYDTPRSLAKDADEPRPPTVVATPPPTWDSETLHLPPTPPPEPSAEREEVGGGPPPHRPDHAFQALDQSGESSSGRGRNRAESCISFAFCATCGGYTGPPSSPPTGPGIPAVPEKAENHEEGHGVEVMERNCEAEEKAKYELLGSSGRPRFLQETEGSVFVFPPEGPAPERPWPGDGVTYVNIPISPAARKQLNYMELDIQEGGGPGVRGPATLLPAQRTKTAGSTKYAHIDIAATETAHKVGTQHALGREEGLRALEMRRRGAPQ